MNLPRGPDSRKEPDSRRYIAPVEPETRNRKEPSVRREDFVETRQKVCEWPKADGSTSDSLSKIS